MTKNQVSHGYIIYYGLLFGETIMKDLKVVKKSLFLCN